MIINDSKTIFITLTFTSVKTISSLYKIILLLIQLNKIEHHSGIFILKDDHSNNKP